MSERSAVRSAVVHDAARHEVTAVRFRDARRMDESEHARAVKLRKVRRRGMQPPVDSGGRRGIERMPGAVAIGKDAQLRRARSHKVSIVGRAHKVQPIAGASHMDNDKNTLPGFGRGCKSDMAQHACFQRQKRASAAGRRACEEVTAVQSHDSLTSSEIGARRRRARRFEPLAFRPPRFAPDQRRDRRETSWPLRLDRRRPRASGRQDRRWRRFHPC